MSIISLSIKLAKNNLNKLSHNKIHFNGCEGIKQNNAFGGKISLPLIICGMLLKMQQTLMRSNCNTTNKCGKI